MSHPEYDLCVIGGGAAGLVVAAGAAALGAKVVLVEKNRLGGDCLWYGCVPSKALLQSAKVAHLARTARRFGVQVPPPQADIAAVMERVTAVIRAIAPNDSPERFRAMGVDLVFGNGAFSDPHRFVAGDRTLTARRFVIATGSRPFVPPIAGLDEVPYLTNETVFALREPVAHLIVLGGGPIGVEMAQAFARLGSRVTVVQRGAQVLDKEDSDVAAVLQNRLRDEGLTLALNQSAVRVEGSAGEVRLRLKSTAGTESDVQGSHLLIAVGRRPNSENLGLDQAGVATRRGWITTDRRLRTSQKHIYACGDITGPYLFTHMAEHQAGVVLRNALFHWPARVEQRVVPWCTYSDPEVARVGVSETEARKRGLAHEVYRFSFRDIDRAQADGDTEGFAKLITDPKGTLLGVTLVGPHAGDIIHEYVLAMAKNMKAKDLSGVIHIYPTLAQINRRLADQRLKAGLTPTAKKWMKRLFGLRGG
ncbi:MAG TPA: mercuric reductase [Gammaproteobacteria bacterium]|nr:mercuric reductase [Gammaproteobacteria bacterium]